MSATGTREGQLRYSTNHKARYSCINLTQICISKRQSRYTLIKKVFLKKNVKNIV